MLRRSVRALTWDALPNGWIRVTPAMRARIQAETSPMGPSFATGKGGEPDAAAVLSTMEARALEHRKQQQPYMATSPLSPSPLPPSYDGELPPDTDAEGRPVPPAPRPSPDEPAIPQAARRVQLTAPDEAWNSGMSPGSSAGIGARAAAEAEAAGEPDAEPQAIKSFEMGEYGQVYQWLGKVAAYAEELGVHPVLDWFFTEVTATVPMTPDGERLALYMNDQELLRSNRRATSAGYSYGNHLKDRATEQRLQERAEGSFCWILNSDRRSKDRFNADVYLQWYHRADFLVKRKSREKKEFRQNMTLEQVLKNASQQRRRRVQRREDREQLRKQAQAQEAPPMFSVNRRQHLGMGRDEAIGGMSVADGAAIGFKDEEVQAEKAKGFGFVQDVLPRELREQLDTEAQEDGMEDVRLRSGTLQHTFRTGMF